MFKIRVDTNCKNPILIYSLHLLKKNEPNKLTNCVCDIRILQSDSEKIKKMTYDNLQKDYFLTLPYDTTEVLFNGETIIVERKEIGDPIVGDGPPTIYNELYISSNKDMSILIDFIRSSIQFHRSVYLDYKSKNDTIITWLYDEGYWDKLNRHISRPLKTIYIESEKKDKICDDIKQFLNEKNKERYSELGIRYKRNYLFEGHPGTGKTSFAFALACKFKMDIGIINFDAKLTDAAFIRALRNMPDKTILILEDIDAIFCGRKKGDEYKNMVTFSGLLNALDGIFYKPGLITIMTTNYINRLDQALKRPGRIDYIVNFTYATKKEIQMMYNKFYPDKSDSFESFYSKIKFTDLTMAMVQEYFLEHMDGKSLIKDIHILKKRSSDSKYDVDDSNNNDNLYT